MGEKGNEPTSAPAPVLVQPVPPVQVQPVDQQSPGNEEQNTQEFIERMSTATEEDKKNARG